MGSSWPVLERLINIRRVGEDGETWQLIDLGLTVPRIVICHSPSRLLLRVEICADVIFWMREQVHLIISSQCKENGSFQLNFVWHALSA